MISSAFMYLLKDSKTKC